MPNATDHNLLSAQIAEAAGALEQSRLCDATICSIAVGSLYTHVAICKQGKAVDTACLELGFDCMLLDADRKVSSLSEGAQTFLDAVAKNIKLADIVDDRQISLLGELIAETIVNLVCRKRPPQVSQRLLCTEPLQEFHIIDEFWLSGLTDDGRHDGSVAAQAANLSASLAAGLLGALKERQLRYRVVSITKEH